MSIQHQLRVLQSGMTYCVCPVMVLLVLSLGFSPVTHLWGSAGCVSVLQQMSVFVPQLADVQLAASGAIR